MPTLRSQVIRLAHKEPTLRPYLLPLLKTSSGDPFQELDANTADALRAFTVSLAYWMGNSRGINVKEAMKVWRSSPTLRKWLARYANDNIGPLYYGGKVDRAEDLPTVGSTFSKNFNVLHWSRKRKVSEWFAGLPSAVITKPSWTGGYLAEATSVPVKEIVADLAGLSKVCRSHPDSYRAIQPHSEAVGMFLSNVADGEMEVLTTNRVTGKVIEARLF